MPALENPVVFRILLHPGWEWVAKKVHRVGSDAGVDVYQLAVVQRPRRVAETVIDQPPVPVAVAPGGALPVQGLPAPPYPSTIPLPPAMETEGMSFSIQRCLVMTKYLNPIIQRSFPFPVVRV